MGKDCRRLLRFAACCANGRPTKYSKRMQIAAMGSNRAGLVPYRRTMSIPHREVCHRGPATTIQANPSGTHAIGLRSSLFPPGSPAC
jgi:hypothetical protein